MSDWVIAVAIGLVVTAFGGLYTMVGILMHKFSDFLTNHWGTLNRQIGRIEEKLGIKEDEKK